MLKRYSNYCISFFKHNFDPFVLVCEAANDNTTEGLTGHLGLLMCHKYKSRLTQVLCGMCDQKHKNIEMQVNMNNISLCTQIDWVA